MSTDRREFLERLALGATALTGAASLTALRPTLASASPVVPRTRAGDWDTSWTQKITGKHKAIFDVPEIENGFGVWRSSIWRKQFSDVLGASPDDTSAVVVLRHSAIVLAMSQAFWDAYGIGKSHKVHHPLTEKPITANPAMLSSTRGEVPAAFDGMALDQAMSRGTIFLACDLALRWKAGIIEKKDKVSADEAYAKARGFLIPGVILQPSGVFAALLAQEAGCSYLRAS